MAGISNPDIVVLLITAALQAWTARELRSTRQENKERETRRIDTET